MKINIREFLLAVVCFVCVLFVLGSGGEGDSAKFEISSGGVNPDVFVLNTQTGELYRYLFYRDAGTSGGPELIRVEALGSPGKPSYKKLAEFKGEFWGRGI